MTARARALASLGLLGLCLGTLRGQMTLSLVSFAVIVWILLEWFRFQSTLRFELPRIKFQRLINGREDGSGSLWAGRRVQVLIRASSPRRMRCVVQVRDFVSEIIEIIPRADVEKNWPHALSRTLVEVGKALQPWIPRRLTVEPVIVPPNEGLFEAGSRQLTFTYEAYTRAAGRITFPGLRLTAEDIYGLFRIHRFVEVSQTYRILPRYFESGELRPTIKRHNSLPRHGIHRLERSGMGSELLELREYVAGDPPKSIAWKVSARRDKLLTRQYESEVPVRVHIIVDGSIPTRVGGFGLRLLDQINYVAASVAKAAIAVGDPVDCTLIDEKGSKRLPWFSGDRGLLELLKALADFSITEPPTTSYASPAMLHYAMSVCHERYPELLDRRFNRVPFSFTSARAKRFQLVGVLSEVFRLSPEEHAECVLSDAKLALYVQYFLSAAGMPWMSPVVPPTVEVAASSARRMQSISDHILKAIAHAHDNEVFVVLADLISSSDELQSLKRAAKLAITKHHRIAFVCPTTTFLQPKAETIVPASDSIDDLLLAAERTRVRDVALRMKRDFVRLGASITFSGQHSAIQMVLAELDTARHGRSRPQGVRK